MDESGKSSVNLSVSIVSHNSSLNLLGRAVRSLCDAARVARREGLLGRLSVYIVDNASGQAYRADLEREMAGWPRGEGVDLHYIPLEGNRGFGSGHNSVLPKLSSDCHLILNPDVELEDSALVVGLCALARERDIALLSPRVSGSGAEQEFLCKRYPSVLVLVLRGFAPGFIQRRFERRLSAYEMRDFCSGGERADVEIASGCFMLMPTGILRALGGFDEDYFLYFEDFDLSLRLRQQGRLVFEPRMRIVHHGGYASSKGLRHIRYFITSGVKFFNRHGWRWM